MTEQYEISTSEIIERTLSNVFCVLSLIGGLMIISSVVRCKKNRENVQQKLLCFMSIADVIFVFLRLTGPLWAPREWKQGNVGNRVTCNIQGFLFGIVWGATAFYNCALALYYLLVIKYNWKPLRLRGIEKYLYLIPPAAGIPGTVLAIIFDVFNKKSNPYDSCFGGPDAVPSIPKGFALYYLYIGICTFSLMIVFNVTCMALVYAHVQKIERRSRKWSMSSIGSDLRNLQKTKVVQKQFQLFTLVFLTPSLVQVFSHVIAFAGVKIPPALNTIALVLLNTSGFLNALVYFRLRFGRIRRENPDWHRLTVVINVVKDTLFPECVLSACCKKKGDPECGDLEPTLDEEIVDNTIDNDIEIQNEKPLRSKSHHNSNALSKDGQSETLRDPLKTSSVKFKEMQEVNCNRTSGDWRSLKAAGVQTSFNK